MINRRIFIKSALAVVAATIIPFNNEYGFGPWIIQYDQPRYKETGKIINHNGKFTDETTNEIIGRFRSWEREGWIWRNKNNPITIFDYENANKVSKYWGKIKIKEHQACHYDLCNNEVWKGQFSVFMDYSQATLSREIKMSNS